MAKKKQRVLRDSSKLDLSSKKLMKSPCFFWWAIPANQRYKGVCGIRSKLLSRWWGYMVGFWNSGNWASNGDLNLDLAPSGWCQRQFLKKAEPAAWWFKCNDSEASTKALNHEFAKFPTHESSQNLISLRIHVWNIYLHWDYFKLL